VPTLPRGAGKLPTPRATGRLRLERGVRPGRRDAHGSSTEPPLAPVRAFRSSASRGRFSFPSAKATKYGPPIKPGSSKPRCEISGASPRCTTFLAPLISSATSTRTAAAHWCWRSSNANLECLRDFVDRRRLRHTPLCQRRVAAAAPAHLRQQLLQDVPTMHRTVR